MKKQISNIVNYALLPALGLGLLYLSLRNTNLKEIQTVLLSGNYWVMLPVLLVSIMVYVLRVARWKILYKSLNLHPTSGSLLASLSVGYLVNFAVPRLGEITRALILKKQHNFPINLSLSTIIFERIIDVVCLVIILATAFLAEINQSQSIFNHFTKGVSLVSSKKIVVLLAALALAAIGYWLIKKYRTQIGDWFGTILEKLFELLKMKQKGWFILYTLGIWIGFYLMTYLWFFMFEASAQLNAYDAFLVMVLGVVARTLPIQAGSAGAYHYVVSSALVLLGLNLATGNALAIVIHGFQTVFTIVFGFSCYLWLLSQKNEQA